MHNLVAFEPRICWKICGLAMLLILGLSFRQTAPVLAAPAEPPTLPSTFYGRATIDGNPAPLGAAVTAVVNGVVMTTTTVLDNGIVVYQINIPGDDPLTQPQLEGGRNGDTVVFQVAGQPALPTAIWNQDRVTKLDLLAYTTPPPPIHYALSQQIRPASAVLVGEAVTITVHITNTGDVVINSLLLTDTYNPLYLTFVSATPAPDFDSGSGRLNWNNLVTSCGSVLAPNATCTVTLHFIAHHDTTLLRDEVTLNTAQSGDQQSSIGVRIINPAPLTLDEIQLTLINGQVYLHWRTNDESQVLGFFVVRQDGHNDGIRLNSTLLSAQQAGQTTGARYDFVDTTVQKGHVYHYLLEIINQDGQSSYLLLGSVGQQTYLPWVISQDGCCQYIYLMVIGWSHPNAIRINAK